jgi:hypothetical protein
MSEAKFTKGPWKIETYHETDDFGCVRPITFIENAECQTICEIDSADHGIDEFDANAHLIAAAPDMYAVASNFEIQGPDDDGMVWLVLHGRKATGRAMVRIGHKSLICAQVALKLEADRAAALRKARGEE